MMCPQGELQAWLTETQVIGKEFERDESRFYRLLKGAMPTLPHQDRGTNQFYICDISVNVRQLGSFIGGLP